MNNSPSKLLMYISKKTVTCLLILSLHITSFYWLLPSDSFINGHILNSYKYLKQRNNQNQILKTANHMLNQGKSICADNITAKLCMNCGSNISTRVSPDRSLDDRPAERAVLEGNCTVGTGHKMTTGQEHHHALLIHADLTGQLRFQLFILCFQTVQTWNGKRRNIQVQANFDILAFSRLNASMSNVYKTV